MNQPFFTFISTNEEGATVELLVKLVNRKILILSEIDPCCRSEIEEEIIKQLRKDPKI